MAPAAGPTGTQKVYIMGLNVYEDGKPFMYIKKNMPPDIVVKTTDGQLQKCHKPVLAANSRFFMNKLAQLKEGEPLELDISMPMLDLILQYIYEGNVDVPINEVMNFIYVAKALELDDLVKQINPN